MPRIARDAATVVFAKAPEPGAVKTRLIPVLGEAGAAALHAQLVKRALATATRAQVGAVTLCCAPDTSHPFFHECASAYGIALWPQVEGDVGQRMHAALEEKLHDAARVVLIGSDCPALTAVHLREAERTLREGLDAVFAPAEDGGYGLIGLKRAARELFDGIPWSGRTVMDETRMRLRRLGWRWRELETIWDVDWPDDYERLRQSGLLSELPEPIPKR